MHIDLRAAEGNFGLYASHDYELTIGGLSLMMSAEQFAQLCDHIRPWVSPTPPDPDHA